MKNKEEAFIPQLMRPLLSGPWTGVKTPYQVLEIRTHQSKFAMNIWFRFAGAGRWKSQSKIIFGYSGPR